MTEIIHDFPKQQMYPCEISRINSSVFDTIKTDEFQKWFSGKNPYTNRKIKIGSKTHHDIAKKLHFDYHYSKYNEILKMSQEEIYLYKKITQEETDIWNKKCLEINEYNKEVKEAVEKISKLQKWEEYILFYNKKYGLPTVHNNTHMENNCGHKISHTYESCDCHICENWISTSCSRGQTKNYICDNCGHIKSEIIPSVKGRWK